MSFTRLRTRSTGIGYADIAHQPLNFAGASRPARIGDHHIRRLHGAEILGPGICRADNPALAVPRRKLGNVAHLPRQTLPSDSQPALRLHPSVGWHGTRSGNDFYDLWRCPDRWRVAGGDVGPVALLVPVLGFLLLNEKAHWSLALGAAIGFAGLIVLSLSREAAGTGSMAGNALVLLAVLCASFSQIVGRRMNRGAIPWFQVATLQVTGALIAIIGLSLATGTFTLLPLTLPLQGVAMAYLVLVHDGLDSHDHCVHQA